MRLLLFILLLTSFKSYAQCKSSIASTNGDKINCIDNNDLKQGRWVVRKDGLRGEPGYEEEGIYVDGKKEGIWRLYTSMGDLFAIEKYRWGNKDGINQYFDIAGMIRAESWKAVNPANPYDTVDVIDPMDANKVEMRVVKIEGSAVKHGKWKYFESATGRIVKSENWFLDKIEDPNSFANNSTKVVSDTTMKPVAKVKPQAVLDFEKKAGKKGMKVIDGKTKF
jgi:antitoxin component YwqK of YwqJK toxin-antitoxin module